MNDSFPLPPDYHSHTLLCKHATDKAVDYAHAAVARGVPTLACTEHCPAPEPFSTNVRMALDEFPVYREWVDEAKQVDGVNVLFGIEADYYEDCEAFLGDWLPAQNFDYVLGSVHFLYYDRANGHALTGLKDGNDPWANWTTYFERIALLARTGLYDVVAHFDLPKRYQPTPADADMERIVKPALDAIAEASMGIEINTSAWRQGCPNAYPSPQILQWACERSIPISFGSDAHTPDDVGFRFEDAVAMALDAGYTERAEYLHRKRTMVPLIAGPDSGKESAE